MYLFLNMYSEDCLKLFTWFTAVLLKLGAAAPQGAMKLKSGSREIFKYLKKNIF
jgi:hypothetical protein